MGHLRRAAIVDRITEAAHLVADHPAIPPTQRRRARLLIRAFPDTCGRWRSRPSGPAGASTMWAPAGERLSWHTAILTWRLTAVPRFPIPMSPESRSALRSEIQAWSLFNDARWVNFHERWKRRDIGVTSTNRSCGGLAVERQGVRQTAVGFSVLFSPCPTFTMSPISIVSLDLVENAVVAFGRMRYFCRRR